jgi:glyceraldehyde 3-phosphate dehydrogenase
MATIGINGFGRIGRLVFRAMVEQDLLTSGYKFAAVNDLVPAVHLAYLLKYDSTQGGFKGEVATKNLLPVPLKTTLVLTATRSRVLPLRRVLRPFLEGTWVDIVVESTGLFTEAAKCKASTPAQKVIISAPERRRH